MSQKLFNQLGELGAIPIQSEMDDIIFTVLEEYGEGFGKWYLHHVITYESKFRYVSDRVVSKELTWPEVIQEYRKYCSQQNVKP
jgi:hypothetical protein